MKICNNLITKIAAFFLICGVVLLAGAPPVAAANVNIPDANLRKAINKALGANRAATAAVTEAEMKTLTSLTARNASISDLTGVEKATNLTRLSLGHNSISDISHLADLTNLTGLSLDNNSISDISHLADLTNLTWLWLGHNSISDISHLADLTNLTRLSLWQNSISDISHLADLTNLTWLGLSGNSISDISHLADLTNLTWLSLPNNSISDISHLADLTNLTGLELNYNRISDISHLADLTNLTRLSLWHNRISDISHLADLTNLTTLWLDYNRISDISHLADLTNLTTLGLSGNSISDISHLSDLTNLTGLELDYNSISDISHLADLTNLTWLSLHDNSISDISPLVSNTGLRSGNTVYLSRNPLSYSSIFTHIPALQTRRVTVSFPNRVPTTLTKVSGDAQTGAPGTALANPFVVEVKDGGEASQTWDSTARTHVSGAPVTFAGVPVTFAVTGGGGTLSATSVATDATGRAQTTLTLGTTSGTNTVTATVTHAGRTLTQTFTANRPPTFTSAATFSVAENTTAVGIVVADDADSQDSVTGYEITGGVDSAKFAITNAGVLTFVASPDYDAPGDLVSTEPANAAGNNEYIVVVTATSGTGARQTTATQTLTITVTDVNEPPGKPGTPIVTAAATTPTSLSVSWTAPTNTGPAITAYNLQYRKNNEVNWTADTYAGTDTSTTLTGLTPGTTYDVQVMAKNSEGDSPWSNSGSATTGSNTAPAFSSASTFSVVENTTAVGTVVATDADSTDSVTGYEITAGADSSKFAITNAGVLTFAAAPDYDNPGDVLSATPANAAGNNQYIVVVTATSGTGARQTTATQTLTITVTDVPPPGKPAAPTVTAVSHTSLSATWTAPTNTGPAIDAYNVQYRAGTTGTFTPWPHTGTAKTTTITGLAAGTSYQVQVRAASAEGKGPWSDASAAATTTYQAEDVDADGDVDTMDLVTVVNNFGSPTPGRNDVDNNGTVDAADVRAVFNAVLAAEAEAAPARAQTRITHTAKTLHHYVQTTKQDRMLDANVYRGLAVLEELIEPFLLPDETALLRNYPNPFNPETWFPYQLSSAADVTFAIYSVNGTLVRTLSLGHQAAGVYRSKSRAAYWDGRNALGEPAASGIYFYTLTAGDFTATSKMLIRK